MRPLTIALLGAESTGKSALAERLAVRLTALWPRRSGAEQVVVVPETLRAWCEQQGRTPRAHEQEALALAQTEAVEAARNRAGVRVVLADTTALSIAAYSEHYFQDPSLYPHALAQHQGYDLNVLMGLDLPWVADALHRDGPATREAVDAILRKRLGQASLGYRLVYGQGPARVANALHAMASLPGLQGLAQPKLRPPENQPWACERCSDPDCEHRLFTGLLRR